MSDQLPVKPQAQARKIDHKKDGPKLGEWYWVSHPDDNDGDFALLSSSPDKKTCKESLMCVYHLASNHVEFQIYAHNGGTSGYRIRYRDLESKTRPEPNWKQIIEQRISGKQGQLQDAVRNMVDMVRNADLLPDPNAEPTLLPAITRRSPEETKKSLIRLKKTTFPSAEKSVERITQELVALQKDMYMGLMSEADRMKKVVEQVDQRLFALELYAGLFQKAKLIGDGPEPDPETPIAVRQMLRYMDEECLFDYDAGGMDYKKLSDFDKWVVEPDNLNRIAPETRCVVALKTRRHPKSYDNPSNLLGWFQQMEEHKMNAWTYLLIRNGGKVYRLIAEIEFEPRLLPFRDEFTKPFTEEHYQGFDKPRTETVITPDDLDYDEHVGKRMEEIYKYNRVMFLLQGLLDRSKVFSPHPHINLADQSHVERYFKPVFDEELGLPSANPPKWEEYRDAHNAKIKVGDMVWSVHYPESEYRWAHWQAGNKKYVPDRRKRERILKVTAIKRDRSAVRVSWPWGNRDGYEHGDYGKWGEWKVNRTCHVWLPMEEVFNISAYQRGDYKKFLCDAYLKGAYLDWAPQLLDAEKWLQTGKCSFAQPPNVNY